MDEIYLGFLKEQKNPSDFMLLFIIILVMNWYITSLEKEHFLLKMKNTHMDPEHFQLSLLNSFTRNMLKNSPNYYILVFIVSTMITYYYPVYIMTPLIFSYFNHYRQCKQNSNKETYVLFYVKCSSTRIDYQTNSHLFSA